MAYAPLGWGIWAGWILVQRRLGRRKGGSNKCTPPFSWKAKGHQEKKRGQNKFAAQTFIGGVRREGFPEGVPVTI